HLDLHSFPTRRSSDLTIRSRLDLAQATLAARKYREALAYATEVLALDPGHVGAQKIRDQARATLDRRDAAIADANRRTAAGDLRSEEHTSELQSLAYL